MQALKPKPLNGYLDRLKAYVIEPAQKIKPKPGCGLYISNNNP